MKSEDVRTRFGHIYSQVSVREQKYIRNFNRYNNNGIRRDDLWTPYIYPLSYVAQSIGSDGVQSQLNIIKSAIDTSVSKVSQAQVRPFFNPVNGDWTTRKVCREGQQYFDNFIEEKKVYAESIECLRDAEIFDYGVLYVDPEHLSMNRVAPWEYFVDPSEFYHNQITCVGYLRKYYPLLSLKEKLKGKEGVRLKKELERDPWKQGEYLIFYDLYNGEKFEFFDKLCFNSNEKIDFEQKDGLYRRPFVEIFYSKPLKGFFSTSLCDDIYPNQVQVDELVMRIDAASRNGLTNSVFVPEGSNLKASDLENGGGTAYMYRQGPEGGIPVVMTPPIINSQYVELLDRWINFCYNLSGINKMDSQGQKPQDLESGKALRTLEDITSERHQVLQASYNHFLVEAAQVAIDCFPKDASILPKSFGRAGMTWGDFRKQKDLYSIQFSAASALSKDPSEKLGQINELLKMGFIDENLGRVLFQLPDLEGAYTLSGSSYDYCQSVIDKAAETGNLDYLPTIDMNMLIQETIKTLNHLSAVGDNKKYVDNLLKLLEKVTGELNQVRPELAPKPQAIPAQGPPKPVQAPLPGGVPGLALSGGPPGAAPPGINPGLAPGLPPGLPAGLNQLIKGAA